MNIVCVMYTLKRKIIFGFLLSLMFGCGGSDNNDNTETLDDTAASGIQVTVDWDSQIREIPRYAYGINSPANFIPSFSNNQTFMSNLELITQKKSFIRLHGWGMLGDSPEAWQGGGVWNSSKIEQALRPLVDGGYSIMINIPSDLKVRMIIKTHRHLQISVRIW